LHLSQIEIIRTDNVETIADIPVIVIGGGGAGLCAALAARDARVDVLVIERDRQTLGTTAMSTGLIPACGSKIQRKTGIEDSAELFAADIEAKTKSQVDHGVVRHLAEESARTID
jgi:fumarate reductase flavoprotein subunit